MKIVVLGGNSLVNRRWSEDLGSELKRFYGDVFVHHYLHWSTGEPVINLDKELILFKKELSGVKDYVIVGKSAGALLTFKSVYQHELAPMACVFLGTPVLWGRDKGFDVDLWLKGFSIPTLFIHQLEDPVMASSALEKALQESDVKNYEFHAMPGNNHEYSEYQKLSQLIVSFLKDQKINQ